MTTTTSVDNPKAPLNHPAPREARGLPHGLKPLLFMGLALILFTAACGNDENSESGAEPESLGWVGEVEGTNAFVSVIVDDSEAIVYICDGDTELREWFQGTIDDPTRFELTNDAGAKVTAELVDGAFRGQFTDAGGAVHGFDAVEAIGDAGLYEIDDEQAADEGIWAAWVVDNNGNERGAFLRRGVFQRTSSLSSVTFRLSRFSLTNGIIIMNGIVAPNN